VTRAGLALALALLAAVPARAAEFDLLRFFEGASVSRGTIRTLFVFSEDFEARFEGVRESDGTLRLDERFRFADGDRLQRWRLRRQAEALSGTVQTEGSDGQLGVPVPVTGTQGLDGVVLDYHGRAPGGGNTVFHFRHRITGNGDGTATNRVSVRKFGLPLARSLVTFAKRAADLPPRQP